MKSKNQIVSDIKELFRTCDGNTVTEEGALAGCAGLRIFEEPIFGVSSADDMLYEQYKQPEVIGENFLLPGEWLAGAQSVLSFFLPFTEAVRRSNRNDPQTVSSEWLHGRIEGQAFLIAFVEKMKAYFADIGVRCCAPVTDPRFQVVERPLEEGNPEGFHPESAWSERHAAYAAGLGTFCLTRGLISSKGVAGRYGSVILSAKIEPDVRPYTGIYDYCTKCGVCIKKCPVQAISLEHGKNHLLCKEWLDEMKVRHSPRYGCGKCQVGVPCENSIPNPVFREQ